MSNPKPNPFLDFIFLIEPDIGLAVRVFANGPGDLCSIPGRVIRKTQKMVLDASLLNTQPYKVWIKGKVEQSREGVAPSPTPWCSSYRKGSVRVTLDYGRQLYFFTYFSDTGNYCGTRKFGANWPRPDLFTRTFLVPIDTCIIKIWSKKLNFGLTLPYF